MEASEIQSTTMLDRGRALGARALPWLGWPAAGAVWAIWHLRKSYYFYDEWSMIYIVSHLDAVDGMTHSFNGHLWMLQYWLYRIQVSAFGMDSHFFISACFVVALIALHLSMTAVLRAHELPRQFCLMVGGLLTYLGAASQNFIFAVQVSPTLSMAAGLFAVAMILRNDPSRQAITAVAVLLVGSVVLDSGIAISAVVFAGVLGVIRWKWAAVWALTPAMVVNLWWYTTADLEQHFPASFSDRLGFAGRLALQSVGSIVGRDQVAGALLTGAAATLILIALWQRWLDSRTLATLAGGMAAAVVTTAAIAFARAGLPGFNFLHFNRYLQSVAIPLTMAAVPALAVAVRKLMVGKPQGRIVRAVPAGLVVGAFLMGLSPLNFYTGIFDTWMVRTRHQVQAATVVIDQGCPSGAIPDPASFPVEDNPQVSTQLLRELVERGALSVAPVESLNPVVTARMCPAPPP